MLSFNSTKNNIFSASTPNLLGTLAPTSTFASATLIRSSAVARIHSREPLVVTSAPSSPSRRRFRPSLAAPEAVRKLYKTLKWTTSKRKSASEHKVPGSPTRGGTWTIPPSPRRATSTRGRVLVKKRASSISNRAMFRARIHVSELDDEEKEVDGSSDEENQAQYATAYPDSPLSSGFSPPPSTPLDPFATPPQSPTRGTLVVLDNSSPRSISSSFRRRRQASKIVQKLGVEAAGAAEEYATKKKT
ncbi:hypothetical protein R3P38DRAFT_1654517 [Favolaschia claudopus]|uniref:Uncharacterized protein n=1 Tax=Favolaschia claudopus TaxID=2862362 RepID=A0AAW0DMJ0_9AGAR